MKGAILSGGAGILYPSTMETGKQLYLCMSR